VSAALFLLIAVGVGGGSAMLQGLINRRDIPGRLEELARRRNGLMFRADSPSSSFVEVRGDAAHITVRPSGGLFGFSVGWTAELEDPGVVFRISPWSSAVPFSRRVATGDREFDALFQTSGDDPDTVRRVLTSRARAILVKRLLACGMSGSATEIQLWCAKEFPSADVLVSGVDLLVEMARADPYGLRVLRNLKGATRDPGRGQRLPGVVLEGPGRIRVGPRSSDAGTSTRARGDGFAALAPGVVRVEGGAVLDATEAEELPGDARHALRLLGTARVEWTRLEATISWPAIETDLERLQAAVDILRVLGRPQGAGVFR
jgi:hypothetical protein